MFKVDPEQLETRAGRLTGTSGSIEDTAQTLRGAVTDKMGCWGGDEIGRSFSSRYREPSSQVLDLLDALPGQLLDMRDRLQTTARDYAGVDEHNAGLVGSPDAGSR
ncbi:MULTISPECIES: WXG100 family type VII secretion target [Actinoalloteichus]|uniref:WXG100 family type VII secretion target n=1 Tax=Actinoalloteichus fjordicus TaxID=1612552 RepID=A0AAC9LGP6_9PSEU|nr:MULTISPECIES: WXG100 family type VII secretion target [Actinoalloteichus]APU17371.1 hypothetical protein UA74_26830 [Actinoalloteichus fjordicus]APU23455.1 hypothetical protein UA75_27420 [Actinoalloteichus sp. GBA129-24]